MKTRRSSAAPRDATPGHVRYCNYYVMFPDGEVWHQSTFIAGGLLAWVKNTTLYRTSPEAARKLIKSGEYHWKVKTMTAHGPGSVTHRMVIASEAVPTKWGNQKIIHRVGKDT